MILPNLPFNKPFIVGKELYYIAKAVLGGHISGDGQFTRLCSEWMQKRFEAPCALLTHSCTAALEMAALLLDIQPGDEIILPSYTFVSTANAFVLRGATLKFCDIREDTLNMDESLIEYLITPRTKAIIPVHYAGIACEMDAILALAQKHNLAVVEDAAQGVNASYKGKYLGTIGDLGCYSFHETKNFISGEGGALVVNNPIYLERAEILREKGTNRSKFFRGEVDKYTWVDLGSSYLPSDIIAAFLYAQLEQSDTITARRCEIFSTYRDELLSLESSGHLRLPRTPSHVQGNAHMFYILLRNLDERSRLISHLKEKGIHSVFHYVPLHNSPMGLRHGGGVRALPVTESLSERLLRLPCYYEMSRQDVARVAQTLREFFHQ